MKQYFLKLYRYNQWSNQHVLSCLQRQQVNDDKILTLMGHIVAAQCVWINRIKGLPPPDIKLWGAYELSQLLELSPAIDKQWLDYLEASNDFDRELTYQNLAGNRFTNSIETIVIHVSNHSTYHRAQIALRLREKGFEAVNTDFITYDRVLRSQLKD